MSVSHQLFIGLVVLCIICLYVGDAEAGRGGGGRGGGGYGGGGGKGGGGKSGGGKLSSIKSRSMKKSTYSSYLYYGAHVPVRRGNDTFEQSVRAGQESGITFGTIIGIAVGIIAALAVIYGILWFFFAYRPQDDPYDLYSLNMKTAKELEAEKMKKESKERKEMELEALKNHNSAV